MSDIKKLTNFDLIKSLNVEGLATYIHNIQESAVIKKQVLDVDDLKKFLNKEVGK